MTVQQLIKKLESINNKTLEVITEGCDCWGETGGVSTTIDHTKKLVVLITRGNKSNDKN